MSKSKEYIHFEEIFCRLCLVTNLGGGIFVMLAPMSLLI